MKTLLYPQGHHRYHEVRGKVLRGWPDGSTPPPFESKTLEVLAHALRGVRSTEPVDFNEKDFRGHHFEPTHNETMVCSKCQWRVEPVLLHEEYAYMVASDRTTYVSNEHPQAKSARMIVSALPLCGSTREADLEQEAAKRAESYYNSVYCDTVKDVLKYWARLDTEMPEHHGRRWSHQLIYYFKLGLTKTLIAKGLVKKDPRSTRMVYRT